jgi:hypothetical protein
MKTHPNARPTWFRLSDASWAKVAAEYKNGATAAELSAKWKVSPSSVYRHACQDGWTKKVHGDAVARAHAEAQTEAETMARFRQPTPLPGEIWLMDDEAVDAFNAAPLSTDPSDLRNAALARLASAIHGGRDHEAMDGSADIEGYDKERAKLLMRGFVDWRPTRAAVEHETEYMFRTVFLLALAMLLKPENAPKLFRRRVLRFRRDYLGEDDPQALEAADRVSERILKEFDIPFMDFNGPEPRPARKLPARTWPPSRPPYPSRRRLAEETAWTAKAAET